MGESNGERNRSETTAERILQELEKHDCKKVGSNPDRYRCNSPFRTGSDSHALVLVVDDGEHGAYKDWNPQGGSDRGSLYDLAERLGIEVPRTDIGNTLRRYDGLEDYAQAHGVPAGAFEVAQWRYLMHKNRPALQFPTAGGTRYRFLDGERPKYEFEHGGKACLYGLKRAIEMLSDQPDLPLVLCNGEPSVIVAQWHGIPAFCKTGGEAQLPEPLLDELLSVWVGPILLALDSDKAGRDMADKVSLQLAGRRPVTVAHFDFSKGGDLADFCRLYGNDAWAELQAIWRRAAVSDQAIQNILFPPPREKVTFHSSDDAMRRFRERLTVADTNALPLVVPMTVLHKFGGFCRVLRPGKMVGIIGMSGGMKTSLLETWIDRWTLNAPIHAMYYGPEWTYEDMADRRIQRNGGATITQLDLHRLYLSELASGKRHGFLGSPLPDAVVQASQAIADQIENWPGKVYYIDQSELYVEDVIEGAREKMRELRKQGTPLRVIVWDYAQLLNLRDVHRDGNLMMGVLNRLKGFTIDERIISMVASQVTKDASREQEGKIEAISANEGQFLRTDPFNLALTLRPVIEEGERPRGIIGIGKNSSGMSNRQQWVYTDPSHLQWLDEEAPEIMA